MLGKGNIINNNAMNIKQQQYQEIEGLEGITSTPKQKYYYQNALIFLHLVEIIQMQNASGLFQLNAKIH